MFVCAEELTPMVAQLESAKTERESALAAKAETERKSRDFISEQRMLIEKLDGEKVSVTLILSIVSTIQNPLQVHGELQQCTSFIPFFTGFCILCSSGIPLPRQATIGSKRHSNMAIIDLIT